MPKFRYSKTQVEYLQEILSQPTDFSGIGAKELDLITKEFNGFFSEHKGPSAISAKLRELRDRNGQALRIYVPIFKSPVKSPDRMRLSTKAKVAEIKRLLAELTDSVIGVEEENRELRKKLQKLCVVRKAVEDYQKSA